MTWKPSDIQRSEPLPTKITVKLDGRDLQLLDDLAAANGCLRSEVARRIIVAVLEDDRVAEESSR